MLSERDQRRLRTTAYVRFASAAHRYGVAQRAARARPSVTAEVARVDALTSVRDCRVAFVLACGHGVEDIDPNSDLIDSRRTA